MFKRLMRQGLHGRLVAKGVNEVIAYELANIVYPGKDETFSKKPIVAPAEAAQIVEAFVDRGAITETQMIDRIWGDPESRAKAN